MWNAGRYKNVMGVIVLMQDGTISKGIMFN
jgi:hypothetical protein